MKKFLPYILILVIIANIFAPFSVQVNKNTFPKIQTNKVNATGIVNFIIKQSSNTESTITLKTTIEIEEPTFALSGYEILEEIVLKDRSGVEVHRHEFDLQKNGGVLTQSTTKKGAILFEGTYTIEKLEPAESYTLYPSLKYVVYASDLLSLSDTYEPDPLPVPLRVNTYDPANPDSGLEENFQKFQAGAGALPQCGISPVTDEGTVAGCGVQLLYYMVFIPTSYLFGLAGKFFDATFGYSILDSSYRSGFVTEGWGIVRDFCNLFFIFVLIYAAFGMILSIHSIKAKEIVINTIIIGLLINFSLLAGQMMIDVSNILARVFYNSETIKITVDKQGGAVTNGGVNMYDTTMGELPLSAALVNKIEPQALIIEASRTQVGDNVQGTQSNANNTELGVGAYFLVIILAIIINIVGAFVFLSVGLIFVARVIGLWFSLIFAPFAFFSYTVPQMQGVPMVGWKKWWPETMGLAFVAPIFMFFLYLILVFLEKGFVSLFEASKGPNFALSIIIPFAFIMILLMTAKKLAKSFSGQMGQMITSAVTAVGAMALGGAALGGAWVARKTIGGTAKMLQNDSSRENTLRGKGFSDIKGINKINPFAYIKQIAKYGNAVVAQGIHRTTGGSGMGAQTRTQNVFQKSEEAFRDKDHAKNALDAAAVSTTHNKEMTYGKLSEPEAKKAREVVNRDELAKSALGQKYDDIKDPAHKLIIRDSVDDYMRNGEQGDLKTNQAIIMRDSAGQAVKTVAAGKVAEHNAPHMADLMQQSQALGEFSRAVRQGTMDIRNLSQIKTSNKGLAKFGVGAIAMIATGVRMGLKQGVGVDHGKGQGDFLKDLGHTITEALKGVKLEVKAPKSDDHGGGHDDGHGGHGGGGGGHH